MKKKILKSFRLFDFKAYDGQDINSDEENIYPSECKFYIQMIGINELGKSCSILVTDYLPFFYIKVSNDWNKPMADGLMFYFNEKLANNPKYIKELVVKSEIVEEFFSLIEFFT